MEEKLIEVIVHGVVVDAISNSTILLLTDHDKEKLLPIWIGTFEAISISQALEKQIPERPLTHDLITNILSDTGLTLNKVVIFSIKNNTYHSYLSLQTKDERIIRIDSRPSDAVAVALRTNSPIYVSNEVYSVSTNFKDALGKGADDLKNGAGKGIETDQLKDWLNDIKPSDF
ncbi:MAG: bifunctional nuclease family protein [Nitrospinae bacterium]|nr:bifunctional nuclease family protein [Nitrospinota bacterium]